MFRICNLNLKSLNPGLCTEHYPSYTICRGTCSPLNGNCMKKVAAKEITTIDKRYVYAIVSGLHGDEPNDNGDYFEWNELLKKKANNIFTYMTWNGRPNLVNHNEDLVCGKIIDTQPIFKEKSIDMLIGVERGRQKVAGKDMATLVEKGTITGCSMGVNVGESVCSICNNLAFTENQWCHHLRYHKGQIDSDTGKRIYENNKKLTGLELSWIVQGQPADQKALMKYLLGPKPENKK